MNYKLLQDLPNVEAGAIIYPDGISYGCVDKYMSKATFTKQVVETHPDWFQKIDKPKVISSSMKYIGGQGQTELTFIVDGYVNPDRLDTIKVRIEKAL